MIEIRQIGKAFGDTAVLQGIDLMVERGEILVLLGPSGCGKTTLLRLIAGLEAPDSGSILIDGMTVAGNGQWIAPEKRQVGMVFQDWALFPHLSVGANVGFGLKGRPDRESVVSEMLSMVDLVGLDDRMPETLSGGQQQRVALARSLAPSPRVLLLDEPFSNLDAGLRDQLRGELRMLLGDLEITSVFVTHDREEALELGDRIAILDRGEIIQCASPVDVYRQPATPWAARLVGDTNLVRAEAAGSIAESLIGILPLAIDATGSVEVLVRPESLRLSSEGEGLVARVRYRGNETLYRVRLRGQEFSVSEPGPPRFAMNDRVALSLIGSGLASWPTS